MPRSSPPSSPSLFDGQARAYDRRAALPEGVGAAVAQAVAELAELEPGDSLVEIGAGTGLVGRWFPGSQLRYLGIDFSLDMLAAFRAKSENSGHHLLRADGNHAWPVADGCVAAIFSSRALHLLSTTHVASEVARVARPPRAALLTGRLRYERAAVRNRIAAQMRHFMRQEGHQPRGGDRMQRRLVATMAAGAGVSIPRREIARWSLSGTPRQAIEEWRGKPGLGGIDPPPEAKRRVLDRLEEWARSETGDLDRPFETGVAYVIEGLWIGPLGSETGMPGAPAPGSEERER